LKKVARRSLKVIQKNVNHMEVENDVLSMGVIKVHVIRHINVRLMEVVLDA
jgi:hypothetical protein